MGVLSGTTLWAGYAFLEQPPNTFANYLVRDRQVHDLAYRRHEVYKSQSTRRLPGPRTLAFVSSRNFILNTRVSAILTSLSHDFRSTYTMESKLQNFHQLEAVYKIIDGIPFGVSILVPKHIASSEEAKCPLLVHFHGGGLVIGTRLDVPIMPLWYVPYLPLVRL
jgi:acetyl esterase/lipase